LHQHRQQPHYQPLHARRGGGGGAFSTSPRVRRAGNWLTNPLHNFFPDGGLRVALEVFAPETPLEYSAQRQRAGYVPAAVPERVAASIATTIQRCCQRQITSC